VDVKGGSQATPEDFEVYGSCVYTSPESNTTYLFVNSKTSEYLQYELTATNGTLSTTLARRFFAGSGGQVEGCVSDPANGVVFIGEEPYGLWKYDAEPTGSTEGVLVDSVDGGLFADVEGVTVVEGSTPDHGWIIVSCQGVSAYNVYERKAPHKFVRTFAVEGSKDGKVDRVTLTDGVAAMGGALGDEYPNGIIVFHDDVNRLSGGGVGEASFKIVDLGEVLAGL
jgi:3-phytase